MGVDWDSCRWQRLYCSLEIRELPCSVKPLLKPTDEALDRFEEESGFRLPISYREFVKVFGPGELGGDHRLRAPGYLGRPNVDLGRFNADVHGGFDEDFLSLFEHPEQLCRVIFFCVPGGGDLIGWDPEDVRDPESHEYGIYEIGEMDMVKRADSFPQFIEEVCLGPGEYRMFAPDGDFSGSAEG